MKAIFVLALALVANSASAQTYTCNFTEPFFNFEFSDETNLIKMTGPDIDVTFEKRDVEKDAIGGMTLRFGDAEDDNYVLRLVRDFQGSDGMSDLIYPYSAELNQGDSLHLIGGCYSETEAPREADYSNGDQN